MNNLCLSLQTVVGKSRTFSLDLCIQAVGKGALEGKHCGESIVTCGSWRHSQLRRPPQKDFKRSQKQREVCWQGELFSYLTLSLHHKAISFPNQTQPLPSSGTEEVLQGTSASSEWALIGTSLSLNIHYLQLSGTQKV